MRHDAGRHGNRLGRGIDQIARDPRGGAKCQLARLDQHIAPDLGIQCHLAARGCQRPRNRAFDRDRPARKPRVSANRGLWRKAHRKAHGRQIGPDRRPHRQRPPITYRSCGAARSTSTEKPMA